MARSIESQRNWWINGVWFAAFLLTGPFIGLIGTVLGMRESFEQIEKLKAPTPGDLAVGVHASMVRAVIGSVMGLAGAALLTLSLIKLDRLKKAEAKGSKDDEPKW